MRSNMWKWIAIAAAIYVGAMWFLYEKAKDAGNAVVGAIKDAGNKLIVQPVEGATVALAGVVGVNEAGGFEASDGQNNPTLQYHQARVAYATSKGYAPGSPEWIQPPDFPTLGDWLDNGGATVEADSNIFR